MESKLNYIRRHNWTKKICNQPNETNKTKQLALILIKEYKCTTTLNDLHNKSMRQK